MKKIFLLIVLLSCFSFLSKSTHIVGGDTRFVQIGPNQYVVYFQLFRDCNSGTASAPLTLTNVKMYDNISNLLAGTYSFTRDSVETLSFGDACYTPPGLCVEVHYYSDTVTIANNPAGYYMTWEICCRNYAISNILNPGSQAMVFTSQFPDPALLGGNSNPKFVNFHDSLLLILGERKLLNFSCQDADGDSLNYSLFQPFDSVSTIGGRPFTRVPLKPGHTLMNLFGPGPVCNLNSNTGYVTAGMAILSKYALTVKCEEFRNGVLVGSQIREMQVIVDPACTNTNPTTGVAASCGGAASLNLTTAGPSVNQTDPNSILMCPDDNVCFEVNFSDPDGDNVTVSSPNVAIAMPGATFTIVGNGTPNPVGTFCWTPTPLDSGLNVFAVIAEDDACPIIGTQTFVFDVTVFDEPYAGLDDTICGNQEAQLTAQGGAGYVWSVITGDPIVVGTNFSCTNCYNPLASPSVTTTYLLTSTLAAACNNTDTVTIVVVPSFTVTTALSDSNICLAETVNFDVTQDVPGTYTYTWGQPGILDNTTISNPTGLFNNPGSFDLDVTVNLGNGCVVSDTVTVNVAPAVVPDVNILTPDSLIECGDSVLIDLDLGGGIPAISGPSLTNTCSGPTTQNIVGVGLNNVSNAPSPYFGFYEDGRVQMIYTPAEIIAAGFVGGKITEMGWYITNTGGASYNDLTIKMGVTALNNFNTTTTFVPGLSQVYTTPNFLPTGNGWTTHTFNTAFDWDGLSNIIIEYSLIK